MPWSATISSAKRSLDADADLHVAARLGVLDGVLDEVAERRDQLPAIADDGNAVGQVEHGDARSGGSRPAPPSARSPRTRRRARRPGRAPAPRRARSATAPSGRRSSWRRGGPRRPSARTTRCTTSRSSSSASASASTARAPTGVFSSWLMLATKSVRIGVDAPALAHVLDRRDRRPVGQRPAATTTATCGGP